MLLFLNDLMPYLGLGVCLTLWRLERFNTKPLAIQLTLIIWIVAMIMLYLADSNPNFTPVMGSVVGRYLILMSIITVGFYVYSVTNDTLFTDMKNRLNKITQSYRKVD